MPLWKKLNSNLNSVRLREKMLILYFFAVFFPIIITNLIFYSVTTENVKNQRIADLSRAVEQIKNDFRAEIDDAVGVSSVLLTDYLLNDILDDTYDHATEYIYAYDSYIRRILNSYTPVYHSVQSITVYVENPTISPVGGSIQRITENVKTTNWYEQLSRHERTYPVVIRTEGSNLLIGDRSVGRDRFSIVREMNYFGDRNNWQKILKIDLRPDMVQRIFSNHNLDGDVYLLNERGEIEYTNDTEVHWPIETVRYDQLVQKEGMVEFVEPITTVHFLNGWSVVAAVSEASIVEEVRKSRNFILLLAGVILLVPTLVILWMVRTLNARIIRILKHMKKVRHQNFSTIVDDHANDEIGQLTSEFNRMTLQIKSLINDVYIADIYRKNLELQKRQAQLNALQSQINPHFIFNALETLRMRSMMKNETETAHIIRNLAKIMRNALTWNKDMLSVQEELELTRCFLEIQKYRFGDKLTYELDVEEAALDCTIPKMTFLPFVENASIHGIESLKTAGVIRLSVALKKQRLLFTLADNGVGMSEQKQNQLQGYMHDQMEMGDRIGVQNVIYRLRLYYGNAFSFRIDSKPGDGTVVKLEIPTER